MKIIATAVLASLATAVVACAEPSTSSQPKGPTPVAGSEPPAGVTEAQNEVDRHVADKIASARCDHEDKCEHVGTGRKFATRDVCQTQLRSDTMGDLNAQKCPRGLDKEAIDRCVAAINQESCSISIDMLARVADCRSGAICMK
jgi:Family of unknown function (DUF6184)